MASLNDTINAITGRLLSEPLAPAVAASERGRNERDKIASENRLTKRAMDLEERRAKLEEEKATSLLKLRNEFDEKQCKLNREGRLEEIKAQASAYVDRLTESDKRKEAARLRALGIELSGKDIDEQIADGLKKQATGDYPKARGAVGIHRDYETKIKDLDSKIAAAEKADQDYISKTAKSLAEEAARKSVDGTLSDSERKALGGSLNATAIRNAKGIPTARRSELLAALEAETISNQTKLEVGLTSSQLDRPTGDALKTLRNERMRTESQFSQFQNSDSGRLAMDRILFERGSAPAATDSAPTKFAAGVDAFDAVRNRMTGAAPAGAPAEFRPAMGERQAMEQAPMPARAAAPEAPAASPMEARNAGSSGTYWGTAQEPGLSTAEKILRGYGRQDPNAPQLLDLLPDFSMPTMDGIREGIDSAFAPIRNAGNAIGRAVNPAIDAKAVAIWGPDAVPLLKEAEQLATSRGMDPGEQQAVFNAAISGDTNAQGKVKLMLDYVRQAKQADQTGAFQQMLPPQEYPGTFKMAPAR